jgi:DNA-binding response OmpR family regulator
VAVRTPIILVVDDERALLGLMTRALAHEGWEVYRANDGGTALAIAKTMGCGLNIVVTDICMPGIDGNELIRQMRKMCPYVDVLAISGALPEGNAYLENVQFLTKPFDVKRFVEEIRGILSRQPW